jgi:Ca2+-binding RTX toxin-like protein
MNKIKEHKKSLLNFNDKKKFLTYNLFCIEFCMLCIFVSILLINPIVIFSQDRHNNNIVVNDVWAVAEEINGTENADNITGTINKDFINGLNGNDNLIGKEAGDDISGGSGNDTIYGNDGRDILWGKSGNDKIDGEKGNDRLYGSRGSDVLIGGSGKDTLTGGIGQDIFICGTGDDTIRDFNKTQKDTIPQNDCENAKYGNTGHLISLQQQQEEEDKNLDKEKGFFFGLFK